MVRFHEFLLFRESWVSQYIKWISIKTDHTCSMRMWLAGCLWGQRTELWFRLDLRRRTGHGYGEAGRCLCCKLVGGECQLPGFLISHVFLFGVHDKSQKSQDDDLKSKTWRREDGLRQKEREAEDVTEERREGIYSTSTVLRWSIHLNVDCLSCFIMEICSVQVHLRIRTLQTT